MSQAALELVVPEEFRGQTGPATRLLGVAGHVPLELELERYRKTFIQRVKARFKKQAPEEIGVHLIAQIMDQVWAGYRPTWNRAMIPWVLASYTRGILAARHGQVPEELLHPLAEQYAETMGQYFNESSKQALIEGFNTYVNRKVPPKLALEMVLDTFGMTPRQTRAYVAADKLDSQQVTSAMVRDTKRQKRGFIRESLAKRFKIFAEEETFSAEQHAHQLLWLYMEKNGQLPEGAMRQWITADDEKVCPQCGPLHGKRVPITEPFYLKGSKTPIWTPGLHVNCRCSVRLYAPPKSVFGKADTRGNGRWDREEHPYDPETGQFVEVEDAFLKQRIEAAMPKDDLAERIESVPVQEKPQAAPPKPQAAPPKSQARPQAAPPPTMKPQAGPPPRPQAAKPQAASPVKLHAMRTKLQANRRQIEADQKVEAHIRRQAALNNVRRNNVRSMWQNDGHRPHYQPVAQELAYAEKVDTPEGLSNVRWERGRDGQDYAIFGEDGGSAPFKDLDIAKEDAYLLNPSDGDDYIQFQIPLPMGVDPHHAEWVYRDEDFEDDEDMQNQMRDVVYDVQRLVNEQDEDGLDHQDFEIPGMYIGPRGEAELDLRYFKARTIAEALKMKPDKTAEKHPPEAVYIFRTDHIDANHSFDVNINTENPHRSTVELRGRYRAMKVPSTNGVVYVYLDPPEQGYYRSDWPGDGE